MNTQTQAPHRLLRNVLAAGAVTALMLGAAMGYTAERGSTDAEALQEAERALEAIATKHGTQSHKLLMKVLEKQLARKEYVQGRVSMIGTGIFAAPENERNVIGLGDAGVRWQGAPHTQSELVLASPKAILGSISVPNDVSPQDLTFVWFQPNKVWFFDARNGRMGHVERPKPE